MLLGCVLGVLLAQSPTSVSLDLRALPEKDYRRLDAVTLERKVTVRLIQDGFAVLSPEQPSVTVRVRIERTPPGLLLKAEGPLGVQEERVAWDHRSVAELHLELAQKISALVRSTPLPAPPKVEPPPAPESVPAVAAKPAASNPPRESHWEVAAAGAASFRQIAPDPLVILSARRSLGNFGIDVELAGSTSPGSQLAVWEARLALGVSHRFMLSERLGIEPRLAFGGLLHSYHADNVELSERAGTLLLPAAWARLAFPWNFTGPVWLEPFAAACLTRPVEHVSEAVPLWHQGVVRVEAGAALRWSL